MALLKFIVCGGIKKYFKSFILAWREKQNIKNVIKKINLEKNKINNKQVRNRTTKSGWVAKSFRAR